MDWGGLRFYRAGIVLAMAMALPCAWLVWQGRRRGLTTGSLVDVCLGAIWGGLIAGRLGGLLLSGEEIAVLADFLTWQFSYPSAIIGGGVGGLAVWTMRRLPWEQLNLVPPALAWGYALSRLGYRFTDGGYWSSVWASTPLAIYEMALGLMAGLLLWWRQGPPLQLWRAGYILAVLGYWIRESLRLGELFWLAPGWQAQISLVLALGLGAWGFWQRWGVSRAISWLRGERVERVLE